MLSVLDLAREPSLDAFSAAATALSHAYVEARDNVKFLNTLERHFKNLATGSLGAVAETLPAPSVDPVARPRARQPSAQRRRTPPQSRQSLESAAPRQMLRNCWPTSGMRTSHWHASPLRQEGATWL
jgi:hypothetical protein